jgi:hypothetical protein
VILHRKRARIDTTASRHYTKVNCRDMPEPARGMPSWNSGTKAVRWIEQARCTGANCYFLHGRLAMSPIDPIRDSMPNRRCYAPTDLPV